MPNNIERYVEFTIPESILTIGNVVTAIDYNSPLPFKQWLNYFNDISVNVSLYEKNYGNYLKEWNNVKNEFLVTNDKIVRESYVSLAKDLKLDALTEQERKFLRTVNYNDNDQVETVIPIISNKINDLCTYYKDFREKVKTQPKKNNLVSSNFGIRSFLLTLVSDLLNYNSPTINLTNEFNIDKNAVLSNVSILIEDLYDEYTDYFDLTTNLPASSYEYGGVNRTNDWNANTNPWDFSLFYDYDQSVTRLLSSYNYLLSGFSPNFSFPVALGSENAFDYTSDKDYIDNKKVNDLNELNLANKIKLFQKFSGTDWYMLSTGNTIYNSISSLLFKADKASNNFLNTTNVSTATIPNTATKVSAKQLGGYYIPNYLGILRYNTFSYEYAFNLNALSANSVYTFPNPEKFINILGNSQYNKPKNIFTVREDQTVVTYDISNGAAFGYINDHSEYLNFHGYENIEEKNKIYSSGISKNYDRVDFFKGKRSNIWSNEDVYNLSKKALYPIDTRQNNLLVSQKDLVGYSSDVYGNQYGSLKPVRQPLFKNINNAEQTVGVTRCLLLNNYDFIYDKTNQQLNYSLSAGEVFDSIVDLEFERSGVELPSPALSGTIVPILFLGTFSMPWCSDQNPNYRRGGVYDGITYTGLNGLLYPDTPGTDQPTWSKNSQTYYYNLLLDGGCGRNGQRASFVNSPTFLTTLSSIVDCGRFFYAEGNPYSKVVPNIERFDIPYSNYINPSLSTTYVDAPDIENASIYSKKYTLSSTPYFRDITNNVVQLSAALSAIFVKYSNLGNCKYQLDNAIKKFDLIYDVGVFETDDYIVIEKINFEYETNTIKPFTSNLTYIQRTENDNDLEQFGNFYFHERNNNLIFSKSSVLPTLSSSNYKTLYPTFYKFDIQDLSFKNIYPANNKNLFGKLSSFSFRSLNSNPNDIEGYIREPKNEDTVVFDSNSIQRPTLSYDPNTNVYGYVAKISNSNDIFCLNYASFKFVNGVFQNKANEMYFQEGLIRDESFSNPLTAGFLSYNKLDNASKVATWDKTEGVLKLGE